MTRLTLLGLMLALVPVVVAAPVPKVNAKVEPADLTALHALIAKRAPIGEWSKDDTAVLEKTLETLRGNVAKATDGEPWKLPVKLDYTSVQFKKGPVEIDEPGVFLVDGDVERLPSGSVVLSTGVVREPYLHRTVVISNSVRATGVGNSMIVAKETVLANGFGNTPKNPAGCFVVAGKRIRAAGIGIEGGVFHVVNPDLTCDPRSNHPDPNDVGPVMLTTGKDATFLVDSAAPKMGDKTCKRVELKAAIAK